MYSEAPALAFVFTSRAHIPVPSPSDLPFYTPGMPRSLALSSPGGPCGLTAFLSPPPPASHSTICSRSCSCATRRSPSELSLLPSSPWALATSSPITTTALAMAAGKLCRPQSSCPPRRYWRPASLRRGEDPTVRNQPFLLLVLFKGPLSVTCVRNCAVGAFHGRALFIPTQPRVTVGASAWAAFPTKQMKLCAPIKGSGRSPGLVFAIFFF